MKKQTAALAIIVLGIIALLGAACEGDKITVAGQNSTAQGITVTGEGKATGQPDIAVLSLGISTLQPTVAQARDTAATTMQALIDSVKANGVAEKDVQTSQLSIYPEYDYSIGSTPKIIGYRLTNTVTIKVRDINKTSDVLDGAVAAGGDMTQVQNISFTIDKPDDLKDQAREAAVNDAKARAQRLADTAGVKLGKAIAISETSFAPPVPLYADGATLGSPRSAAKHPNRTGHPGRRPHSAGDVRHRITHPHNTSDVTMTEEEGTKMNRRTVIVSLCTIAVGIAVALSACGGSESSLDRSSSGTGAGLEQKTSGEAPLVAAPDTAGQAVTGTGAMAADNSAAPNLAPSDAAVFDRKIIQDTSLDLQVENVTKSYNDVERIAITAGGYVLDSSVSANQEQPQANITIRVPTSQYQSVVDQLRGMALKVENQTSKAQDVTDQYTDLQARLRSAQTLEATYLTLLDKAETIDDIIKIQSYLTPVRTEIEQIQGQIQVLDNLSSLATIRVDLHTQLATPTPTPQPASTHPDPLKAGGAGWESSLVFLRAVGAGLFATVAFLWWLVPIWVIVGVGFLVRYRMMHKSGSTR